MNRAKTATSRLKPDTGMSGISRAVSDDIVFLILQAPTFVCSCLSLTVTTLWIRQREELVQASNDMLDELKAIRGDRSESDRQLRARFEQGQIPKEGIIIHQS